MDIKKAEEKVKDADSLLTTLGKTLWKHKWLLLFLLFSYCVYWAFTQPDVSEDQNIDQVDEGYYEEHYEE